MRFLHPAMLLAVVSLSIEDGIVSAQNTVKSSPDHSDVAARAAFITRASGNAPSDLTGTSFHFIQNIGQYGETFDRAPGMGQVKFGYEGFGMPVLFTEKGLIYVQREVKQPDGEEKEEMERKGMTPEAILEKTKITDRTVTMQWLNANPHPEMVAEEMSSGYFTYGTLAEKAQAFKKLVYKELYPGIDLEYSFTESEQPGFEYKLIVHPGADISKVNLQYGGDIRSNKQNKPGGFTIKTSIGSITETAPVSFYLDDPGKKLALSAVMTNNLLRFEAAAYDHNRTLIIDPFISATTDLTGTNAGKAKDVDFDYAGNIYVTGGGDGSVYKLAKYNAAGVWQWTFGGSLSLPSWFFGTYYGGWVVEKTSGNIYLGQGFNYTTGFAIIRLNTGGIYDNYITTTNVNFREDWKMYWSCNSGLPKILIAGGGTNSNINFGICSPPSTVLSSLNVTGIAYSTSTGWAQDIADIVIDPVTNDMYTIYGSLIGTPSLSNKIYKNTSPYSAASVSWSAYSGFTVIQEIANRPYMAGGSIENSCNVFAINSSYLFYWDGRNLKAINKANGNGVGSSLTISANVALYCGGIIADECNNIFVGSTNGTIKVYKFNGSTFDDAAEPDIAITGYPTKSVYDLAFDESKGLLYASGDGFVASFDITSYGCTNTSYTITPVPNCATTSVTTTISPAPPSGSVVTYNLYDGTNLLASNSTGTFTGLTPGITYTIIAYVNETCSGTSATADFTLPGPVLTFGYTDTDCGLNTGTISASGSGGTLPYQFSIDGTNFQGSGNFTGLGAGVYTLVIKDATGCSTTAIVTIINSNGPTLTYTKTDALCGNNNGTITAISTGGTPPLQYSIDGVTFQTGNFFTGLFAGTYTLTVKDATDCINEITVTIINTGGPSLTATPATTYCNSSNGSITAYASGGTPPYTYSINGNTFQAGNVFSGLAGGSYTVTVQDANGCTSTYSVTVANSSGPTVSAVTTVASCNNYNGTITATGSGGTTPYTYSINGVTFQSSNFFGGLTAGSYTITIKDANGCTNTVTVTVNSSNAPTVTATSDSAACNLSNGSVMAVGTGGSGGLTYSINGATFQASGSFSGLAPGTYTILVKDATGCIGATSVTVYNLAGPTVTAVATPTSCGAVDGIITATGSGGTGTLNYSIDGTNFQLSNTFSSLATGTYTITVKDANGCISTTTVTVTNASGLSLTASSIATPCSGSSGTITASATGGIGALQYSINGVTYQSSNVFTGVGEGTYTVTVVDGNGCSATATVSVGTVFAPTVTASVTNANCNSSNGIITATGSGGTVPYTYSINGVTFQSSNIFSGLAPGTYTVTIKDANGCTGTTTATIINVGTGTAPTFSVTVKSIPCEVIIDEEEGEIKVINVSGGTAPYTYSINGVTFQTSSTFKVNTPGTYTITVKDANGCTSTMEVTISVDPPPVFQTITVTNATCGSNNGSIYVLGVGSDDLQFNLNNGTWVWGLGGDKDHYTWTGLAPGVYTIYMNVPGDGNCNDSATVTVLSSGGPTVTLAKTDATCGLNNGSITATGSGGTAPLSYSINNGSSYQSSGVFSNLAAGTYTILVKDSHAVPCLGAATITINAGTGPALLTSVTPTSCGLSNGTITVSGSGGTAPLEYSINGTTFQSGTSFSGLSAGTYTVWVKDNIGCFSTTPVTVTSTSFPNITAYALSASCGNSNGSLVATGSGGSTPYQFSLNGGTYQSSGTFTGLSAGVYTITIKDLYDCTNSTSLSVNNLTAPTLSTSSTASKCSNANGSITAMASGGTPPLMYSIDGITFQASNVFTNVSAGTYTVTVKDNNGCTTTKLVTVSNIAGPSTLTATVVSTTCGNSNGKITAASSGGTAPITYSKDGVTFQASTVFNGLSAGNYTITVKDNNGCTKTLNVTVPNLPGPGVTATATPSSSCTLNDGTITATATGGTLPITYSKDGSVFQTSNIFTALSPGTYTITAKDVNGCTGTTTITVGSAAIGPTLTWTGSVSTNWHDIDNWGGCAIPDCAYDVIIPSAPVNQPLISMQDASCRTITINTGASLTVSSSKTLMVCYNYTNSGAFSAGNSTTVVFEDTCLSCVGGIVHDQVLDGAMTGTNKFWNATVKKPAGTVVTAVQNLDMAGNFLVSGAAGYGGRFSAAGYYHKVAGNFTVETAPLLAVYTPADVLEFNGTAQTYQNRGILESVVMNQSGAGTLTLQDQGLAGTAWMQLSTSGTLTLTYGKIIAGFSHLTDNRVDVFNRDTAAVSEGNTSSFVQGVLRRYMPNAGDTGFYNFPVGGVSKGYERIRFHITAALPGTVDYWNVYFDETTNPASPMFPTECGSDYHNGLLALNHGLWTVLSSPTTLSLGTFDVTAFNKPGDWTNATGTGWTIQSDNQLSNTIADWFLTPFPMDPCIAPPVTAVRRADMMANALFTTGNPVWFANAQSASVILPIELLNFTATAMPDRRVRLDWKKASEINNDYFTVERAGPELGFEQLEIVDGAGNSFTPITYRTYDNAPLNGLNYYRLKQTDFDGSFEYSNVVSVNFTGDDFLHCYPNPVANQLIVSTNQELVELKLIAVTGVAVYEHKGSISGTIIIDLSTLPSGCYMLKAMNKEGAMSSEVIVKARNDN